MLPRGGPRRFDTDDVFGALARSARIVEPLEQLFDDEVSHYYTLNMRKDPNTGGWQWHQDYGYHYQEFFYPNFISVMVALDPANRDKGLGRGFEERCAAPCYTSSMS